MVETTQGDGVDMELMACSRQAHPASAGRVGRWCTQAPVAEGATRPRQARKVQTQVDQAKVILSCPLSNSKPYLANEEDLSSQFLNGT